MTRIIQSFIILLFAVPVAFGTDLRGPRNRSSGGKTCLQTSVSGTMTDGLCVTGTATVDPVGGFAADSAGYATGSVPGLVSTAAQTFAGAKTFSAAPVMSSLTNGSGTLNLNTTGTMTVPNATDTLAGIATAQTLTNKTISGASNTLTIRAADVPSTLNATTFSGLITDSSGINFGGSTLSTYVNRTSYTPTFNGSSTDPVVTYGTRSAYYERVGDMVMFTSYIQVTAESNSGSGNLLETLPVDTSLTSSQFQEIPCTYGLVTLPSASDTGLYLEIGSFAHYGTFVAPRNASVAEDVLPTSSVTVGGFNKFIICTGTYFVN